MRLFGSCILGGLALLLAASACGSDESGSSSGGGNLVSFKGSACKKDSAGGALTVEEAQAGLQCIRWKPGASGAIAIELVNFAGACGAQWKGQSKEVDGGVELRVVNPECLLAACGVCIYDWSFEVKATAGADLPLSVVTDPCPDEQPPTTVSTTLPLSTLEQGELCRYADHGALGWQASSLGTCGKPYMPCKTTNGMCQGPSGDPPCDTGLTCADGAKAGEQVCHAPCTGDAECVPAGTLTCQDGLCRPAKPW